MKHAIEEIKNSTAEREVVDEVLLDLVHRLEEKK